MEYDYGVDEILKQSPQRKRVAYDFYRDYYLVTVGHGTSLKCEGLFSFYFKDIDTMIRYVNLRNYDQGKFQRGYRSADAVGQYFFTNHEARDVKIFLNQGHSISDSEMVSFDANTETTVIITIYKPYAEGRPDYIHSEEQNLARLPTMRKLLQAYNDRMFDMPLLKVHYCLSHIVIPSLQNIARLFDLDNKEKSYEQYKLEHFIVVGATGNRTRFPLVRIPAPVTLPKQPIPFKNIIIQFIKDN